jgi:hypothetical protein
VLSRERVVAIGLVKSDVAVSIGFARPGHFVGFGSAGSARREFFLSDRRSGWVQDQSLVANLDTGFGIYCQRQF